MQRTLGNQAVTRLIAERAQPRSPQASLQRQPTAEETEREPGAAVKGAGDVSVYAGKTMTAEATLREVYQRAAREISDEALRMVANGATVEDAARFANQARNDLKVQIRARGSPITRGLAEARNLKKYGNKVGPTYDDLIRRGKTPEDIIGASGRASTKVNRIATRLRVAGRFMIAIDVAIVTWEVIEAPEGQGLRTAVAGGGGIAGALAGGWAGAKGGAAFGTLFGPWGTAIGGVIGGIGGALAGGWAGREAGGAAYDLVEELFTPNLDGQMEQIDSAEDRYIRERAGSSGR
jgi:hypothetical protein